MQLEFLGDLLNLHNHVLRLLDPGHHVLRLRKRHQRRRLQFGVLLIRLAIRFQCGLVGCDALLEVHRRRVVVPQIRQAIRDSVGLRPIQFFVNLLRLKEQILAMVELSDVQIQAPFRLTPEFT